jgi:flagellar motility protein MotE (MotC chaperone)
MTPKVGVLSAVCAVAVGALAFKGLDIAQAFAVEADNTQSAPAAGADLTAGIGEEAAAAAPSEEAPPATATAAPAPTPEQCLTQLNNAAEEMGLSSQEILVLRSLQKRREELDARETGLETREQAASAAEQRLQEQISDLKKVETEVQGLLTQMTAQSDKRMADLVKSYEAMKPKDAARIFNGMEDKLLVDIAKTMKPATLAAVMSTMEPKRAEALTRLLADLAKPPTSIDALQKSPT